MLLLMKEAQELEDSKAIAKKAKQNAKMNQNSKERQGDESGLWVKINNEFRDSVNLMDQSVAEV